MIKYLLIGIVVLVLLFFIGGMFFYGGKPPGSSPAGGSEEAEQSNLELILPLKKEDLLTKYQGIWPFGIRGGDHPNGHPGIDFETKVGAPILAVANGKVTAQGDALGGKEQRITIDVEAGQTKMTIWYVGEMEKILVKVDDMIKVGDTIAYAGASKQGGRGDTGFLHFETSRFMPFPPGAICPAEFMSKEAKADLDELFKESKYKEREEFPLLCNKCPEGFPPFGGCR